MPVRHRLTIVAAWLCLAAASGCGGPAGFGSTPGGGITAGPLNRDQAALDAAGFVNLPEHRYLVPGVADDQRPEMLIDPTSSQLAILGISGDGCPADRSLEVTSQTDEQLELQYTMTASARMMTTPPGRWCSRSS